EEEPYCDGAGDTDTAEHDPGPGGPATPKSTVGCADVAQGSGSDPDGRDAGHDPEDETQQTQRQCVPGATVDRARGHVDVPIGVHAGMRSRRVVAKHSGVRVTGCEDAHGRTPSGGKRLLTTYTRQGRRRLHQGSSGESVDPGCAHRGSPRGRGAATWSPYSKSCS